MSRPTLIPDPAPGSTPAPPSLTPLPEDPVEILARTLWGEARGEGAAGMEAVAAVVLNRLRAGRPRWGLDLGAVCLARRQFSCWNPGDPNRAKLLAVTPADPAFATALRIARRAAAGLLPDPVQGATHYHARGVMPGWSIGQRPVATIGRHLFYTGIA